jgi:hypothetical protein
MQINNFMMRVALQMGSPDVAPRQIEITWHLTQHVAGESWHYARALCAIPAYGNDK